MDAALTVRHPGLFTTVQDLGRPGCQDLGVSESGAVDPWALQVANWLVGNPGGVAALEASLLGPTLVLEAALVFAVAGADCSPTLNGRPVPPWTAVAGAPGDVLALGSARRGCRAYLAVAGGVAVPLVLGSAATDVLSGFGGLGGRPLRAADRLPVGIPAWPAVAGRSLPEPLRPAYPAEVVVRVVLGPQDDHFTDEGIRNLLSAPFTVDNQSNRMGARLLGPAIAHRQGADIISDGMPLGGIQVPPRGTPIVLLANRQTMGGYAKVATVITPDVGRVGQLRPGERVRFAAVSLAEAHAAARAEQAALDQVAAALLAPPPHIPAPVAGAGPAARAVRRFRVRLAGEEFQVTVAEEE